jgi:hypothetical protein
VVRLKDVSFVYGIAWGTPMLAYWEDDTIHRGSGRPLLKEGGYLQESSPLLNDNIRVHVNKEYVQARSQDEDVVIDVRYLGSHLAIVHSSVPGLAVRPNDIVRLNSEPAEQDPLPEVTDIVYKPNPRFSEIVFDTPKGKERIQALAVALGAEVSYTLEPADGAPGVMIVYHQDDVNFERVVKAAGFQSLTTWKWEQPCLVGEENFLSIGPPLLFPKTLMQILKKFN